MAVDVNVLDWFNIFVNEIFGSIELAIILIIGIALFFMIKYRTPYPPLFVALGAIVFILARYSATLFIIGVLFSALLLGWKIIRLIG